MSCAPKPLELRPPCRRRDARKLDSRGAVYLESLIAFVTLLGMFFCIAELILIGTANLMVRHSAMIAVRAAAVIRPPNPNSADPPAAFDFERYHMEWFWPKLLIGPYQPTDSDPQYCKDHPDDKDKCALTYWNNRADHPPHSVENEVTLAAKRALYPWNDKIIGNPAVTCDPKDLDLQSGGNTNSTCTVQAAYACVLPIARHVLCSGGVRWLKAAASFPHQGAYYKPEYGY